MNHMVIHAENKGDFVEYDERYDEYYMPLKRGSRSPGPRIVQQIYFCPWCGGKLPDSRRDEWFDKLEEMGVDPMNDEVPVDFKTSKWRCA